MCAGTLSGGLKASATNKKRYGEDYYKKIGSRGGRATGPKGFALMDPEKVKAAGRKGGSRSKRTGVTTGAGKKKGYYYDGDGVFKEEKTKPKPKKSLVKKIFGGE